jgi:hypothetical protein
MQELARSLFFGAIMLIYPSPSNPHLVSWILRVDEVRQEAKANHRCKPAPMLAVTVYSRVTVDEEGGVLYRESIRCNGRVEKGPLGTWPAPGNPNEIYPLQLSDSELKSLISFLNTQEVRDITDFMNAGPIFDNYEILIRRGDHQQRIKVLAFLPSHYSLREHPALTQLICRAKEIAGRASQTKEMPDWCKPNSSGD